MSYVLFPFFGDPSLTKYYLWQLEIHLHFCTNPRYEICGEVKTRRIVISCRWPLVDSQIKIGWFLWNASSKSAYIRCWAAIAKMIRWVIPYLIQFNVWILPKNDSFNIWFNIASPNIQNIIQFKENSADSIQKIIQFKSQGIIDTDHIRKVPKNCPKSVQID